MHMTRRSALALLAASAAAPARAQQASGWPNRMITLVVPFPPGPAVDFVARQVARKLSETLGQSIVVENRTGANGSIGATAVARAQPDGYTLLIGTAGTHGTAPHLTPNLPYDPVKDFSPIIAAVEPVTCLAVNASVPAKTVEELIAYAKQRPGQLSYGSSGVGSVFHLFGEMFNRTAGLKIVHVPYRGVEPAMSDVIAGHIPMTFISVSNALPSHEEGKARILAVLEPARFSRQPQIPSMSEILPEFRKPSTWFGFLGPASLDPGVVARLNAEIAMALSADDVRPRLEDLGFSVIGGSPDFFGALIRDGLETYGALIREANAASR
jgi:tripartite-type tricarboxylate transporter receptor subunit TctC